MEVLIQEEQLLPFERSIENYEFVFPDGTTSTGYARVIRIPPVMMTQELLDQLISAGIPPRIQVGQSTAGFDVRVGHFETACSRQWVGSFELIDGEQFLLSLFGGKSCCLEEAIIKLQVANIVGQSENRGVMVAHELTTERTWLLFNSGRREVKRLEVTATQGNLYYDDLIYNWTSGTWSILLSVKLILPRFIGPDPGQDQDLLAANRKMLTDEVLADTKVIARNGAEIKFHRSFLAAHSPAFESMFHAKMQEGTSGVLELPDMNEESVRALKEYLYSWELKAPQENSLVCIELFEAGHKYGISSLVKATFKIFMSMGGAWFSAEVALRLFLLVRNMQLPRLKLKAVEILKLKGTELTTLDKYHDLFKKEYADAAKELFELCLFAAP